MIVVVDKVTHHVAVLGDVARHTGANGCGLRAEADQARADEQKARVEAQEARAKADRGKERIDLVQVKVGSTGHLHVKQEGCHRGRLPWHWRPAQAWIRG